MIVISDSTPLITLMKADCLDILREIFGDIFIPETVFSEVTDNETYQKEAEMIRNSNFIKVVKVHNEESVSLLQRIAGLDKGECEAIIFADESNADLLLMDEAAGRKTAKKMGLKIMGSVGVLISAFKIGLLSVTDIETAFYRIRKSNRHISERIIQDAMDIVTSISIKNFH